MMTRLAYAPSPRTLGLLLAVALAAPPAAMAADGDTGALSMQFDGYAHGLTVLKLNGTLSLTANGYAGRLALHTAGMINWVAHMDDDTSITGHFTGDTVAPDRFDSEGVTRGQTRVMHMAYVAGQPHIERQLPTTDPARTPVAPADTAGTIDTLSAIALLIHRVADHDTCDGAVRLFDGRRLTALTARTAGQEMLPHSGRGMYNGTALRCDFEGTRQGGFLRADDEAQQRRPRHGSAWLARLVPGAPPVPVRVTFDNKVLGAVTLYLTAVTGRPGVVAQNAGRSRVQ